MTGLVIVVSMLSAAAVLAAGSRGRRAVALGLGVIVLAAPFVFPAPAPLFGFIVALVACWGTVRINDLCWERVARPWPVRVWHVFAAFDTRETSRAPARFDGGLFLWATLHAVIGAAGLAGVTGADALVGPAHAAVRWLSGTAFVYGTAGAVADFVRWFYLLLGVVVEPIQCNPIASRSLREFWGERWNRVVGGWLRQSFFLPLARRGHGDLGLALAFAVSALLHGYMVVAAAGAALAFAMTSFFVAQAGLMLIERSLGLGRRPRAGRLWFLVAMAVSVPLFVEPMLAVILPAS